jgi:rhamnogalacturonyl hydrolase YesR
MRKFILTVALMCSLIAGAVELPAKQSVLDNMLKTNSYFMKQNPDPTWPTYVNRMRSSNLWTRAVYYEGLMALYSIYPDDTLLQYVMDWGDYHKWTPRNGNTTRNADNYCCSQTYIDVYNLTHNWEHIKNAKINADMLVNTPQDGDWTWIDAIQMGMPVLAKLGAVTGEQRYFDKAWAMYSYTRNVIGGGLFNKADGLWWRDADFVPPYKEPNGKDCYWSRGNGWVYAALVRVLEVLPTTDAHRADYLADFKAMSKAIKNCRRSDGFWNVSLHDPDNFGGKELSGTALFTYGLAWGVRNGILDSKEYLPIAVESWNAMVNDAVKPNGFLGYVQGTGKQPSDGQPVTLDHKPDFEDYGLGCFLLAGSEIYKLK